MRRWRGPGVQAGEEDEEEDEEEEEEPGTKYLSSDAPPLDDDGEVPCRAPPPTTVSGRHCCSIQYDLCNLSGADVMRRITYGGSSRGFRDHQTRQLCYQSIETR